MSEKRRRRKNAMILVLFCTAILMAVGYAVYSTNFTINTTGKIYSDWDIRFTDVSVFDNSATALGEVSGSSFNDIDFVEQTSLFTDLGIDDLGDTLGGIILNVLVELTFEEDYVEFAIDITNYSETWDAELVSISSLVPGSDDFIVWSFYEANDYTSSPKALTTGFVVEANATKSVILKAAWNPAKTGLIPDDAIKKSIEEGLFNQDGTLTHHEEKGIVLVFEATTPAP